MQLDATIDDVTATANQIYHISDWQSQWRHRLWRRRLHLNLSRVSAALCGKRCLALGLIIPRGQSVSGRVVQAKWIDREGLGKRRSGTRQRSMYIHVHFSRNMNIISLLGWLASRGIIEVKVTDNDEKNCTKFTWYLNCHQNLRSPHHFTSVRKSPELSWQGCRPLRCLVCYCSLISETDSRSASFIRLSIKGIGSSVLLPGLTVFLAGCYSTTLYAAFSGWQALLVLSFSFHKSL